MFCHLRFSILAAAWSLFTLTCSAAEGAIAKFAGRDSCKVVCLGLSVHDTCRVVQIHVRLCMQGPAGRLHPPAVCHVSCVFLVGGFVCGGFAKRGGGGGGGGDTSR